METNAFGGLVFAMREGIRHDGSALRVSETLRARDVFEGL